MVPFRPARNLFAETDPDQAAYIAKLKFRYLVQKELNGEWTAMARLASVADADRFRELGFALGGHVRVEDLSTHQIVFQERFQQNEDQDLGSA